MKYTLSILIGSILLTTALLFAYNLGFKQGVTITVNKHEKQKARSQQFSQVMGWCEFVEKINEEQNCGVDMTKNPDRDFLEILNQVQEEADQCKKQLEE